MMQRSSHGQLGEAESGNELRKITSPEQVEFAGQKPGFWLLCKGYIVAEGK